MTPNGECPLAPEASVVIHVDGIPFAELMCTPCDLDELAVGHLFARGLIASRYDLKTLSICPDMRAVKITTMSGIGATLEPEGLIVSACGAGGSSLKPPPRKASLDAVGQPSMRLEDIAAWAAAMFKSAELYRKTGGLHVAALAVPAAEAEACGTSALSYFAVREDVGRHNALDKVLGRALLDGADFSKAALLTSGRIAADMALKAVAAGLPILVTRSIPTSAAYSIALEAGISIVGRIGTSHPLLYTRPDRILEPREECVCSEE